jgi:hypothetical protein
MRPTVRQHHPKDSVCRREAVGEKTKEIKAGEFSVTTVYPI